MDQTAVGNQQPSNPFSVPQDNGTLFQFAGSRGETLIRNPGSINGESFNLRDLTDCNVYLLDFTSEVEVSNCANCQFFIGPVDGPCILDSCKNCNVAVASQQFQAKSCTDCDFSLYCATGPTLSGCSGIKVSCWNGKYAGLNEHFAAANLDPSKNQWNKVYDASASLSETPNFTIIEALGEPWEVSIETPVAYSDPVADLPVPPSENPALEEDSDNPFTYENGNDANHQSAAEAAAGYDVLPPATAAAQDSLQNRLRSQAREESEKKMALQAAASRYLVEFYQKRTVARDERIAAGREEMARRPSGEVGPQGESVWEKAISMIDFNATRPGGTDLSRFRSVLFAAKERGSRK